MTTTTLTTDAAGRTWDEERDGLWRSTDDKYVIVRVTLPDPVPHLRDVYLLRKIDPEMAKVNPGTIGYSLMACPAHHSLDDAMHWAHTDARADRFRQSNDETLDTLPAGASSRFFWPVSNGTSRGALTLTREGDRIVARVIGMSCVDEDHWEPGTYTEASLPLPVPMWRRLLRRHS